MQPNDLVVSTTGADAAGAFAILAVISDPEAARLRLVELCAERTQIEAALAETRALSDAMVNGREATAREAQEARDLGEANAREARRVEALAFDVHTRDAALTAAQTKFEQTVLERGEQWQRREQAVLAREVAAEAREKRITGLEAAAQALIADYEGRVANVMKAAQGR